MTIEKDGMGGGEPEQLRPARMQIETTVLMSRRGECDQQRGRPRVRRKKLAHLRHEDDGRDTNRADEHGKLATAVYRMPLVHPPAR